MKRSLIVPYARTWLGAKFGHQKSVAPTESFRGESDCVGVLKGIARKFEYSFEDVTDYAHSPDAMMFKKKMDENLDRIELDEIKPGDILTFAFNSEPQHVAVVTQVQPEIHILHAYSLARKVVEHRLDDVWSSRVRGAYRFKNIEEDE